MDKNNIIKCITEGKTALGIELGSTRIKAVLIDGNNEPIASGSYEWSNSYENGVWTYSLHEVWKGVSSSFAELKKEVGNLYGVGLSTIGSIGISAMMHGYLAFNDEDELLVPFRTWRNNITGQASSELTDLFNYPIPQRWSIAHLYQAILNGEDHIGDVSFITTLAGYVHWKLTGEKVVGVGDASGIFPIDLKTGRYNEEMIASFTQSIASKEYKWQLKELLPKVHVAGIKAGTLTVEGTKLLDATGELLIGIPFCPPEGDAGTGMVATNSVGVKTGNVSAGTSVFAMVVLEDELSKVHSEIDQVTTPTGKLVAMVHSNNCTTELNAWVGLLGETLKTFGYDVDTTILFGTLYRKALEGDADCGGLLSYGYHSGEHITHFEEGRPLFVRQPDSTFNLANFIRVNLYTALGALKTGLDILLKEEGVKLDSMLGHGGLFKTEGVGQKIMADAIGAPVSVMETAGEGGAWGIALLASFLINKNDEEPLEYFLNREVFADKTRATIKPNKNDSKGFDAFMKRYHNGLEIEKAAVELLK